MLHRRPFGRPRTAIVVVLAVVALAAVALVGWRRDFRSGGRPRSAGSAAAFIPVTGSPSAQSNSPRMERPALCPTVPDETVVALESVAACLEVGFDARTGRVTAKVVDPDDGRPVRLRADPLNLYAPFETASNGTTEGARVSLHPVDSAPDSDGVPRATLFAGESGSLRGARSLDAILALVVVRGVPNWGVAFHLGASGGPEPREPTSQRREHHAAD